MHFIRAFIRCCATLALTTLIAGTVSVAVAQQTFKTPEEAADSLVSGLRSGDSKAVDAILGPGGDEILSSGDAVQDENYRKAFVLAYDVKHSIQPRGDKFALLLLGLEDFPFAIPIAKKGEGWAFDTDAGREEVLARRIGRNEFGAIRVCLGYVDAQYEYAATMPKVDGMSVYAQRIVSSPGKKDGLYWPAAANEPPSPLGEAVADASLRGYRVGSGAPYQGYYYKLLTRQGQRAPGGAHDYIVKGKMIGGFALIAWPAEYGNSGIATFMVNHDGIVYEKDLGPKTAELAGAMSVFNPDDSWKKVNLTEIAAE